jgi:hypothetical protein
MFPDTDEQEQSRPLGLLLLTGLYLFFFFLGLTTVGSPYPLFGTILSGPMARIAAIVDTIWLLYLVLGLMKRQYLTWYLLMLYNLVQVVNVVVNLNYLNRQELESIVGHPVDPAALMNSNVAAALAMLLVTQYIYRHRHFFSNRQLLLF